MRVFTSLYYVVTPGDTEPGCREETFPVTPYRTNEVSHGGREEIGYRDAIVARK